MKRKDLPGHVRATYFALRIGIAALGIALPFVLAIGGKILAGLELQDSMSAYYHGGGGVMRDEFVGVLCAVGAFLYLYKGYTVLENVALNFAGVFAVGVALFPMQWNCAGPCGRFSLHGSCAVLFFLCIAYVCIFRASDTLSLLENGELARRYRRVYRLLGTAMVLLPLGIFLSSFFQGPSQSGSWVFFVEAAAVLVFGTYWLVKSREIYRSHSERSALEGRLTVRQVTPRDIVRDITVERVTSGGD